MATLTTQTTWHNNPRPTLAYASTAYVSTVTSPYYKDDRTVPTYVSDVTAAPLVLTADLDGGKAIPQNSAYGVVGLSPEGIWSAGTTIVFTLNSEFDGTGTTETSTITLPDNVNNSNIVGTLIRLINANKGNANGLDAIATVGTGFAALGTLGLTREAGTGGWGGSFRLVSASVTP